MSHFYMEGAPVRDVYPPVLCPRHQSVLLVVTRAYEPERCEHRWRARCPMPFCWCGHAWPTATEACREAEDWTKAERLSQKLDDRKPARRMYASAAPLSSTAAIQGLLDAMKDWKERNKEDGEEEGY